MSIQVAKRKTSRACVILTSEHDKFLVNGKSLMDFFRHERYVSRAESAFRILGMRFGTEVKVLGGGISAQADAVKVALARSFTIFEKTEKLPELIDQLIISVEKSVKSLTEKNEDEVGFKQKNLSLAKDFSNSVEELNKVKEDIINFRMPNMKSVKILREKVEKNLGNDVFVDKNILSAVCRLLFPLRKNSFDVWKTLKNSGLSLEEIRVKLKRHGLLNTDGRIVERQKCGQRGARAKFAFKKR